MLGDRIGETRALFFSSINKQNNTITINHSINYNPDGEDYISHTKTKYSQRTIDVSENLISAIEEYKDFLIKKGYNINDNTLIFFNHQNNKPYSDSYLRNQFYKYCEDAGVSKIRLYDLRHTYVATMMQEGKELYLISERLGHTSYSTTVNKYGHLSNEVRKEIAKTTDKYVF
jgi:integrase